MSIPYGRQTIEDDDIQAVVDVLKSDYLTTGPKIAEYEGQRIGGLSDMTTFSFHPVKSITTGEGGMIMTNNEEYYKRLMLFRSHGITRDEQLMTRNDGPWFYQQLDLGYNYRITDIQCALYPCILSSIL